MNAVILSIGDELTLGQKLDTNSAYLSAQLAALGVSTRWHQTVADDLTMLRQVIASTISSADLVLLTGGLGPTADDLTRQALAEALGQPLVRDDESLRAIEAFFLAMGRDMPAINAVQAMRPKNARMIPNTHGTAPGVAVSHQGAHLFAMPGPPSEMKPMFLDAVVPAIQAIIGDRAKTGAAPARVILTKTLHAFGWGESRIAQTLGELMQRDRNPCVGTTVSDSIVSVRLRCEHHEAQIAERELAQTAQQVRQRLGAVVFGQEEQTLAQALASLLIEKKLTLATAESCTGGLLGEMLTRIPGSSAYYLGGWTTYADEMKIDQLGVNAKLLQTHGAVSEPVALAMAQGAQKRSGSDLAVAITGVAGPSGGGANKPVGLIWIALAQADQQARALCFHFPGGRDKVRDRAAKAALQMMRLHLIGEPWETIQFGRRARE